MKLKKLKEVNNHMVHPSWCYLPPIPEETTLKISDFDQKCQDLRGWRIGDIALHKEKKIAGSIISVQEDFSLVLLIDPLDCAPDVELACWPDELINLS